MTLESPLARRSIRWWPAALIVALLWSFWLWVWFFHSSHRQNKNLLSMVSLVVALFLLLVWALLFSRFRGRTRLLLLGTVLLVGLFVSQTVRLRGVTGDLLPIFQWRWTQPTATQLESPSGATPASSSLESNYPQFLGPLGNGKVKGPALARDWKAAPPEELWRQPIGPAWAGFAIDNGLALTLEQADDRELVTCRDLVSGRVLWTHADEARYATVLAGEGPRTVPTIRGNRVYTVGATGNLNCLNLTNGTLIWSTNIVADAGSQLPDWGISCSPLLASNLVIVCPGGPNGNSLVAYDAQSGQRRWSGGTAKAHYSSPVPTTLSGVPQVLMFNADGVSAHDFFTGEVLWDYGWRGGHPHIANPMPLPPDRLLLSSGYGTGSELLQVRHAVPEGWTIERIWKSNRLKSKFANLIVLNDHIYGLDDGILVCLDLESGELQWKEGRYGHGQLILANDLLLVMAESGDVILIEPTPEEHRELTRFEALSSKTWNPPALVIPYLLVRNDKEAACFRLPTVPYN